MSDSSKPIVIDLCCGLSQPKFLARTYSAIEQLVTRRAQYPNHVGLGVLRQPPRAVSLKLWAVCDFKNAVFSARLARLWHIGISALQSIKGDILKLAVDLINRPPFFVFSSSPHFFQFSSGLSRAFARTIPLIAIWRLYRKMRSAATAVAASFCSSFMLKSSNPARALGTIIAAPFLIRSDSLEGLEALSAKQIVHSAVIT